MRTLLIDDDINLGKVIGYQLQQQGYEVDTATNGLDGLKKFQRNGYEIVICDIQMPDISGIDVLKKVRETDQQVVFLIITAYGSVDNAIEACKLGADDYLTKPFGKEQLLFTLEKALRFRNLQNENVDLRSQLGEKFKFKNMVANSGSMQDVLRMTRQVSGSNASVLIQGESGTGKELIAKAIHYNSPRKDKPLVTINCPSIPSNLLESELFGHVKGSFTGAVKDRAGKFEQADGGTIFLDEIGDLHEDLQAKLLRVLQEHEIDRIGGTNPIPVDVRIITATNRNLHQLVTEKKFREDLYYRLSVVPITIPPLRERVDDIPFLVDFFLERYGGKRSFKVDPKVIEAMKAYYWPGNIRELENIIERMVTLSTVDKLTVKDLPDYILLQGHEPSAFGIHIPEEGIALDSVERMVIQKVLKRTKGNQTKAAKLLNIPRHVLLYRLKKLGLAD